MHGNIALQNNQPEASYTSGLKWFVVRTNIRCENRAQMGLDALGYRTFMPKMKKWITHARMKTVVERPLFPRHLFVELEPNIDGFGHAREVDGVESILGTNGTPMYVPSKFVEEFLLRQLAGEFDYAAKQPLAAGCKVRIVQGEYDDLFGVIQSVKRGTMFVKLLESAIITRLSFLGVRAA